MTDESLTTFRVTATKPTSDVIGQPVRPVLVLRCRQGRFSDVFILHQAAIPDQTVTLRFDSDTAYGEEWEVGTGDKGLFAPDPRGFLDSLLLHRTVRVRFTPYREVPQTASFAVGTALAPGTAAFARECGLDPAVRAREIRGAVGSIELAVPDTVHRAPPGPLALRPLVKAVRDRTGRLVTKYRLGAQVTVVFEGRTTVVTGDSVDLEPETMTDILITANDYPAPRVVRYLVGEARDSTAD
jgi:hypothetical protein